MSMKKANNTLSIIAIIISLLALVACCIIILCLHQCFSFEETTFLISVLSLIVTLLIGMQIWNIFQFENKFESVEQKCRDEIEKAKQDILETNKDALEKNRYDAIGTVLMQLGWSFEDKKEYGDAMRTYINALRALQQGNLKAQDTCESYKDVVDRLVEISKELPAEEWHFVDIDEKNVFIDAIMKIPNKDIMNTLLEFFYKFTVIDEFVPEQMRTLSSGNNSTTLL